MITVTDQVELGDCGRVSVGSDVVTHPFEAIQEEVTFLAVKREAVLDIDLAEAGEEFEESERVVRPHQTVVNDLAAVHFFSELGVA